jgi:hypothetical protein
MCGMILRQYASKVNEVIELYEQRDDTDAVVRRSSGLVLRSQPATSGTPSLRQ